MLKIESVLKRLTLIPRRLLTTGIHSRERFRGSSVLIFTSVILPPCGYYLHKREWDLNSVGVVRFGRAALTCAIIAVDYKWTFTKLHHIPEKKDNRQLNASSNLTTEKNDGERNKNVKREGGVFIDEVQFVHEDLVNDEVTYSQLPEDPLELENLKLKSKCHERAAKRLYELCCKNGGAFIKVGQHLGSLDYLLPPEYIKTLRVLNSRAPESTIKDVSDVVYEETHKTVDELFSYFSEVSSGAASLAQVHRATLRPEFAPIGTTDLNVAVKVQHKRVRSHSRSDLATMDFLVHVIAWIFPDFQLMWLANETKINLPKELDFLAEGRHCEKVAHLFRHLSFLKVPKIYWRVSTPRLLVMEFCEGGQVDDVKYMKRHNIDVDQVMRNLGRLYSEMIFEHGYIHSDPHPGNVLVKKSGYTTDIILLDHGLYNQLTDEFRLSYARFWEAVLSRDIDGIKRHATDMNCGDLYILFAGVVTARAWSTIQTGVDKVKFTQSEADYIAQQVGNYLPQIADVLARMPRQMLLILKTNDVLRALERTLGVHADASAFLVMARSCIRAVTSHEIDEIERQFQHYQLNYWAFFISYVQLWTRAKIRLLSLQIYEYCLWCYNGQFRERFVEILNRLTYEVEKIFDFSHHDDIL